MLNANQELSMVLQALEVSQSTYERLRRQYGGMKSEQAKRLTDHTVHWTTCPARCTAEWRRPYPTCISTGSTFQASHTRRLHVSQGLSLLRHQFGMRSKERFNS